MLFEKVKKGKETKIIENKILDKKAFANNSAPGCTE